MNISKHFNKRKYREDVLTLTDWLIYNSKSIKSAFRLYSATWSIKNKMKNCLELNEGNLPFSSRRNDSIQIGFFKSMNQISQRTKKKHNLFTNTTIYNTPYTPNRLSFLFFVLHKINIVAWSSKYRIYI